MIEFIKLFGIISGSIVVLMFFIQVPRQLARIANALEVLSAMLLDPKLVKHYIEFMKEHDDEL